jgi:hypothetical protein
MSSASPSGRDRLFVLRIWQAGHDETGRPIWRYSLRNGRSGKRHLFPDIDRLAAYLSELAPAEMVVEPDAEEDGE